MHFRRNFDSGDLPFCRLITGTLWLSWRIWRKGHSWIPREQSKTLRFLASVKVHLVTLLFEIPSLFPFVRGTPLTISSSSVVGVVCVSAKQGAPGFNGPPGVPGLQVGFVRL